MWGITLTLGPIPSETQPPPLHPAEKCPNIKVQMFNQRQEIKDERHWTPARTQPVYCLSETPRVNRLPQDPLSSLQAVHLKTWKFNPPSLCNCMPLRATRHQDLIMHVSKGEAGVRFRAFSLWRCHGRRGRVGAVRNAKITQDRAAPRTNTHTQTSNNK